MNSIFIFYFAVSKTQNINVVNGTVNVVNGTGRQLNPRR